jgi:hypothetical protein
VIVWSFTNPLLSALVATPLMTSVAGMLFVYTTPFAWEEGEEKEVGKKRK